MRKAGEGVGIVLEPTPEMGAWSVEVFLESACFRNTAPADCVNCGSGGAASAAMASDVELPVLELARSAGALEIPVRDVRAVVAAVDQVLAEPLYADHVQHGVLDLGCWDEPVLEHGWLRVQGPVVDAVVHVNYRWIEVSYCHLAELRYHLVDFLNRSCSDDVI